MEQSEWTREELKAYLLLYAANADFNESEQEKEMILAMIHPDTFKRIHREWEKDNDYQRIEKIQLSLKKFNYDINGVEHLLNDIDRVFMSTDEKDVMNETIRLGLKRLLHAFVQKD